MRPHLEAVAGSGLAAGPVATPSDGSKAGRVRIYDAIAKRRAEWQQRNAYYYDEVTRLVSGLVLPESRVLEIGCGLGDLLAAVRPTRGVGIEISARMVEQACARHPELEFCAADAEVAELPDGPFDYVILSDAIGHLDDVQRMLERLRPLLTPQSRVVITYYNFLWQPMLDLAELVGRKTPWPEQNWLSTTDIQHLLVLSGYRVLRHGVDLLLPTKIPGIAPLLNRFVSKLPVARHLALVNYFVARPAAEAEGPSEEPGVTVVCPCKNERGNVDAAIRRTPKMGARTELLFVDGSSTDGTPEAIEAAIADYSGPLSIRLLSQAGGVGKGAAVRQGFDAAENEILMILDADLTVAPEDLPKFYEALVTRQGDLINGVRLVYPMEGQAMRFLNLLGNKFFSLLLSWAMEQPIKDALCGTKVLYRADYERVADNRAFFGDFDPFGDFDLLFGAARLNMEICDMPIRYRARTYGETKISRFQHGWLLLKMSLFGLTKLRGYDLARGWKPLA